MGDKKGEAAMTTRILFVLMIVSAALQAQQINGSSHLTWTASTSTLTGLGVTTVDGAMGSYYTSYVRAQITDENGVLLVSNSATDKYRQWRSKHYRARHGSAGP
jgi:pheromone shutdown protein TraB